jgi:hypothetical protein
MIEGMPDIICPDYRAVTYLMFSLAAVQLPGSSRKA